MAAEVQLGDAEVVEETADGTGLRLHVEISERRVGPAEAGQIRDNDVVVVHEQLSNRSPGQARTGDPVQEQEGVTAPPFEEADPSLLALC